MAKIPLVPLKSQIDRLQSAYAGAARRIVDILSALDPQTFTSIDIGATMKVVRFILVTLNDQVRSWAPVAIREAYKESAGVAQTRLELIGAKMLPVNRYNPARHDRKIDALTKFVLRDLYKANLTMERTVRKYLGVMLHAAKRIDKTRIQEFDYEEAMRWITRFLKMVWPDDPDEASQARGSISRQIRDYLLSKLEGEDFIRINGRRYGVRDYAELVARMRMREAQTEAVKEMMRQFDNDLVEIPPHDSPCEEICAPYQGQVYSISGTHPKYPLLPDGGPPWHPNCEDVMNPTSENALRWRTA